MKIQRNRSFDNTSLEIFAARAGATCLKHGRHSIIRAVSPENHTWALISRSLCTCIRVHILCTQLSLCCWPIRSFRAESHTTHHTRSLLRSLPPSFSFPSVRIASLLSLPLLATFEILTLPAASLTCGSFLRPQGPQADSPGRLTELTVSTAGWLGVATQSFYQQTTFLLLRVYRRSAGVYLALPASLQPQFTHVTSSNRFAESSRLRSYDFKSLHWNLPPFFLCKRT